MRFAIKTALILLLLLLAGCAKTWVKVDADSLYKHEHYRVALPAGWLRLEEDDSLLLSKDGILVQYISIKYRPHETAFEKIKKTSSTAMLPSELADLAVAEFRAIQEDGLPSLEVLHNRPVEMAGHTGFDIHLRYKTDSGLNMEVLLRGIVDDKGFYLVEFSAPSLHYFERDRHYFESVTQSLAL